MTEHEWRSQLGVYALGMLPLDEEAAVRAHVETCAACHADLDEIAPVARLMTAQGPATATDGPPSDLEDRVVARWESSRAQHRARGLRRRLGAGLAVAAAIAATAVITAAVVTPPPLPLEPVALASVREGVTATANLVNHPWGVELKLVAEGLDEGRVYDVVFVSADGRELDAGGFVGVSDRPVVCNLNVPLLREDTTGFVVTAEDGEPLLTADLT